MDTNSIRQEIVDLEVSGLSKANFGTNLKLVGGPRNLLTLKAITLTRIPLICSLTSTLAQYEVVYLLKFPGLICLICWFQVETVRVCLQDTGGSPIDARYCQQGIKSKIKLWRSVNVNLYQISFSCQNSVTVKYLIKVKGHRQWRSKVFLDQWLCQCSFQLRIRNSGKTRRHQISSFMFKFNRQMAGWKGEWYGSSGIASKSQKKMKGTVTYWPKTVVL